MMVLMLFLAQAAPAGAPPAKATVQPVTSDTGANREIVVMGRPLPETRSALEACLARRCPPMDDMRATLAHADNQFVKGDIAGSRETLMKSIGRNRRFSKTYPIAVAGLFRANGRIAAHLGEGESYRMSTLDGYSALKSGLPDSDPHVLSGSLELADMFTGSARPIPRSIAIVPSSRPRTPPATWSSKALHVSGSSCCSTRKTARRGCPELH
jgi:hypothetical protein